MSFSKGASFPMNTRRILIVDDEVEILERLSHLLKEAGWRVTTATNGLEALKKIRSRRPDAIVLDMIMPEMDGFELTRTLKSHPSYRAIPIVAATSLYGRGHRERCLAVGCDDYVAKPFTIEQLEQRLLAHTVSRG
jgi:CheY-like chemotaxis protein